MAATTLASFYSTLSNMSVTGVTKALDEPPISAVTARIPTLWVDQCGLDVAGIHAKLAGGQRTLRARVVVLMEPMGQDRHANRWSAARTMVGSLDDAITTALTGDPNATWTIDINPSLDDSGYMAVVANVQTMEWK